MKLTLRNRLLFTSAALKHKGADMKLENVLIDTGSGGTVLSADKVKQVNLEPEPDDPIRRILGFGGAEYVFEKKVGCLSVGTLSTENFTVEIGALDYGFDIDGIIGLDFLIATDAILDLGTLQLHR